MQASKINVLMTGAGAPGAPGIIKCLLSDPPINLAVADADTNATGKFLHKDFVVIPKGTDAGFIDELLNVCRQKKIAIVLPLVTKELFPLSVNKELLRQHNIRVIVSSENAINIANNKSECYKFLKSSGIDIPKFAIVNTLEEFKNAVTALDYPEKTICFKPSVSNGSRGFRIVSDSIDEADLLFNYKPNNTYISYNKSIEILSSKPFPQLLVSEYLDGDEYSVDCLANNGQSVLIIPRLRSKIINGISVGGRFINDKSIIQYCEQIIEKIGLHGNIGIQLKKTTDGRILLLEINPRVQGTIVAALGAGVNLPLLAIKQELGLPIDATELKMDWNIAFSRYWTEIFYPF